MAVESGVDYALAPKITWIFETGVGNAFAIVVRGNLFVFPYNTTAGAGRKVTTTTVTIEGIAPVMAIQSLVGDPSTTPDSLLAKLNKWCQDIGKGPIIHDLDAVTEVKLRNGFFTRMVGFKLAKERIAFRPNKAQIEAFYSFFEGDARLV